MVEKFRIGLLTSAWDRIAWELVNEAYQSVKTGLIPNSEIAFVFVSRNEGETRFGDLMIDNVRELGLPLITFSSLDFEPELRIKGRAAEKEGDPSIITDWRLRHDREVMKHLSPTDLDVLLGYMWMVGSEMCRARTMVNLHPALPTGPKGTYREVIWQLIKEQAAETGVMIHLVTEELDMGPPIAYCRFPIREGDFDPLWREMDRRLKDETLEDIAKKEGERNPLFALIRKCGVVREFPMVIWTIKLLAEGRIMIKNGQVLTTEGQALEGGYDLSSEIDAVVGDRTEEGSRGMGSKKNGTWVFVDNEGPCTLNDNAFENTVALATHCGLGGQIGIDFYRRLSKIDDIWGDFHRVPQDPTYSSGHTLKVVLPFYRAMGADSQWLYEHARQSIRVVPHVAEVLGNLNCRYNVWMISTSYEFFIQAFCDLVGFDFGRVCCTSVGRFDEIPITEKEAAILLAFMEEVALMPIIAYNEATGEVVPEYRAYYERITHFVWETLYNMAVGELLRVVHPVGQAQKREALEQICRENGVSRERTMYVGDSQTDVQCVQHLRGAGLTMMFNGKGRVCDLSDIMYIGEDARAIEEVVDLFAEHGREGTIASCTPPRQAKCGGLLATVTPENIGELKERSVKKRKEFRGLHIGDLT